MRTSKYSWLVVVAIGLLVVGSAEAETTAPILPVGCDEANATWCLQAAIERAATTGAEVHIPAGRYVLRTHLQLRDNVVIRGEDGAVIVPSPDNMSEPVLLSGNNIRHVTISQVAFEGGGADFANRGALISLSGTLAVLLDQVAIGHVRGKAIVVVNGDPSHPSVRNGLSNSVIEDVGNHWKSSHQRSDRDVAVLFWDNTGNTSRSNYATGNHFADVGLDALQITGQNGFKAEGNIFELWNNQIKLLKSGDYPAAIFTTRSRRVSIAGNTIHQAVGNGIDAPGLTDSTIENNTITECGQSGIGIFQNYDGDARDSGSLTIKGNTIQDNAIWSASTWRAGISIGGGKPYSITIAANTISDTRAKGKKTQDYGIEVVNGSGIKTRPKDLVVEADNALKGNQRAATHGI